ncbi:microtubule-associated protein 4 isoform X6 [Pogona vitticeps]
MADLDHNLSLADALTEPPPQIEEEVKRDFMATLEAEKFDDVIGETVGKTDYVPLLDDEDAPKAGNQEAKTKPHADSVQADRKSVTGPAAVLENGDHGVEGSKQVPPGKIIDETMSYKEFLDRNDSWTTEDRGHCFESQPAFKPMDVTEPFKMNREDVLSGLLLLPQETMGVPQFGEYFGASEEVHAPTFGAPGAPEQLNPLGSPHVPANLFDPLTFLGADPGAEAQLSQREAALAREMGPPEDFWLGAQHLVEGQGAPFFESPVPGKIPGVAEKHSPGSPGLGLVDVIGQAKPSETKPSAPAAALPVTSPGPFAAVEELMGFEPSFDHRPLPPKEPPAASPETAGTKEPKGKAPDAVAPAGVSPVLEKSVESKPSPTQPKEKEESSKSPSPEEANKTPSGQKGEDGKLFPSKQAEEEATGAKPPGLKAEESKPSLALHEERKESKPPSPKAEEPKASPEQHPEKTEEIQVSPARRTQEAAGEPSATQKAEKPQALPPQPEKKTEEGKVSSGEGAKAPSSPSQPKELPLPGLEKQEEKSKPPPSIPVEKPEEHKLPSPQAKPLEPLLKPAEPKEPPSPGVSKADAKEPPSEKPTSGPAEVAKPKEVPQPHPDPGKVELPQEKVPLEPAGVPPAHVRQANQSSDHRRLGRGKPARMMVADVPEEPLVGFPAQKSHNQGGEPFSVAELGYVAGTSPRGKAAHRKASGQLPFEFSEAPRDVLREGLDLEASAALKKKKKKAKQKRSQQLRAVETWEDVPEKPRAPCAAGPQKPELPPAESPKEASRVPLEFLERDPSQLGRHRQDFPPAPTKGEPALPTEGCSPLALHTNAGGLSRAEAMRDDSLMLLPGSQREEPSEERSKPTAEQSGQAAPTLLALGAGPVEKSPFGGSREAEGLPPKDLGPGEQTSESKAAGNKAVWAAKAAVASAEKVAPEGPACGREEAAEKPKDETPTMAGEGAGKPEVEAKAVDAAKEKSPSGEVKEGRLAASEQLLGASPPRAHPPEERKGGSPAKNAKFDFGSADTPFSLETKSDPAKPLALAEAVGHPKVPFTETTKGMCSTPPEQPAGTLPRPGSGQTKKRGSDGKTKRAENHLEQRVFVSEDKADSSRAPGAEDTEIPEVGFSRAEAGKALLCSEGMGEKTKKKNSEGRSRKAVEKSSFRAPFSPELGSSMGHLPTRVGHPDQPQERTDCRKEGAGLIAANQPPGLAAKPADPPALAATFWMEEPKDASAKPSEWLDFPSSAYPFILEAPGRQMECSSLLEAAAQTKGTGILDEGKEPSPIVLETPITTDSTSLLPASKSKKRSSDGRRQKSGKSPSEQPVLLETKPDTNRLFQKVDVTQETSPVDKRPISDGATLLEPSAGNQTQVPALKLLEKSKVKENENLNKAVKSSGLEQPPASDQKTSPSKPELVAKMIEGPFTDKGEKVSQEHGTKEAPDALKWTGPFPEVPAEERKTLPTEGHILETKPEPSRPAAISHEVAKTEDAPSPREGQGKGSDHLLKDAGSVGQIPVAVLVPDEMLTQADQAESRKDGSSLEPRPGRGLRVDPEGQTQEPSGLRRSNEEGGPELSNQQDPLAKPAKKGSHRKGRKAASGPEQPPVALPTPSDSSERPKMAGTEYGMGEFEFVDENRNLKTLPPGHQVHWEENVMSLFGPSVAPDPSAFDGTPSRSQGSRCPFLDLQGQFVGEFSHEQTFLSEIPKDASRGDWKAQLELQENLAKLEGGEARAEASLLMKAGDETREKRKKNKRPPSDRLVKPDAGTGKNQGLCPVLAEDRGTDLLDKGQDPVLCSSQVPGGEEPKIPPGLAGSMEESGPFGKETRTPPEELAALWETKEEAAALQALTTALVGGGAGLRSEDSQGMEQRASECLDSSGSKAGADKALEDVPLEEAASAEQPKSPSECLEPGGVDEPKISPPVLGTSKEEAGRLREAAAEVKGSPSLGSEAGERVEMVQEAVSGPGDQVAKEAKKQGRAKAPQEIKGYMRPTKSRGLPPPPPPPPSLRAAAQEEGGRRPPRPDGSVRQRQGKAKPEEGKAAAEVATANDVAAPPSKELPPSPEKKAKPSASTSAAKPAAAKTKPVAAAASATAPAKRPASATPGQNKKATSPPAGPAAATTTPKRPATSTTRPSTLTPKDTKPKGTEVKSPDKRTSPSKAPSATTPRPSTKSSTATPRLSTAQTSTLASSPRSTATSPPKRPSTIKTDAKAADVKKTLAKSPSAEASRPKSAPASTTPSPAPPGAAAAPASRPKPKPAVPKASGAASATAADAKKTSALKTAPKTSPVPKPSRPPTSVSAPDLKNVRSKIGSTDNIKYQPGGGKAKVERKAESAGAARKPELNAVSKTATTKTKEGSQKQPNGKVPNAPKLASGNHSQPSTAPRPGQGSTNVQILNKKIDLSKVSSKCGSKANIKHKPGGGDVKIENQKLNFKEKAQAKVGSLDNVGHVPAGGTVKIESHQLKFREKAKARTDHGVDVALVSKPPPVFSGGSSSRRSTSVSESLGSATASSTLPPPPASPPLRPGPPMEETSAPALLSPQGL